MDSNEKNKKSPLRWKNEQFYASLLHALEGVRVIVKEERNMRNHALISLIPVALGFFLGLERWEWASLLTCIFLVILLEFLNTIIETVVDLVTDYEYHPLAKKAKDFAAGAVLIAAIFAIFIGAILFVPKIYSLLTV